MKAKVWLGGVFKTVDQEAYEEFDDVTEIHLNFGDTHGPRTGQMISPETVAIEMVNSGMTYRFQDVEEIEILGEERRK